MARTAVAKTSASTVVSLKVTLRDTKPPIWRRLLMADAMTLADLHRAIQGAMGWHDAHLHLFDIDGRQYGDPRTVDDVADERRLTLGRLLKSGVLRFAYIYDFGDNWEQVIAIEKTRPAIDGETLPACATGKRACPPEDCGGTWGYEHLLEVQADPSHPEYQEQREWIDEESTPRPSTSISPTPFSRPNSAQSKPGRAPSPHADPAYGGWVSNYRNSGFPAPTVHLVGQYMGKRIRKTSAVIVIAADFRTFRTMNSIYELGEKASNPFTALLAVIAMRMRREYSGGPQPGEYSLEGRRSWMI